MTSADTSTTSEPPGGRRTLRTARDRAREQITGEVLAEARRQLGEVGPAGLSLRSVARELGMVPSALYRYVASRDDLLTRLITDAYDALGAAVEQAVAAGAGGSDLDRWLAAARAARAWARAHPHEYALLYGTPVPGYNAPTDTVDPGIRPSLALLSVVREAAAGRRLAPSQLRAADRAATDLPPGLADELAALAAQVAPELDPPLLLAALVAWTQLFGLLSFELFGQTRGMVTGDADLFDAAVARMAHAIGLR